jgi:hypothetical protein
MAREGRSAERVTPRAAANRYHLMPAETRGTPDRWGDMARYFFHTADGVVHRDADGLELPTERAAKLAAVEYLGELLVERPTMLEFGERLLLTVTDQKGRVAFAVQANLIAGVAT